MQLFVHSQQTHTLDVTGTETIEDVKVCTVVMCILLFDFEFLNSLQP